MDRYPFIVIEGLDGTGKTTLRKGLFRLFEGLFRVTPLAVLTTNFTDPAVALDLVEGKYQPTPESRERYLAALAADKQSTAARLISPALPHRPVIADRWLLSELAFFAVKHGRRPEETYLGLIESFRVVPDLTIVLDVPPEAAMERAAVRSGDATRPDWDVLEIQAKVRQVHHSVTDRPAAFAALGPVVRVNAAQDRATVLHTAWQALDKHGLLPHRQGDTT